MSAFVIAEVGPNHNGDPKLAMRMVEELAIAGADAIKFQLSIPENLHSLDSYKARYQEGGADLGDSLAMSRKLNLAFSDHLALAQRCDELGLEYMCTAFDLESLKFLDAQVNVNRFKVPSGELLSIDMLEYMSRQNKPIILSTGMATYDEIEISLNALDPDHKHDVSILHCISNYPAPLEDVNLKCMLELQQRYGRNVGFSDHTVGNEAAIAAVALGAQIIEKHVTLDKTMPGPDHQASATVKEFASLTHSIRDVQKCLGGSEKQFSDGERDVMKAARKSIVVLRNMKKGETLSSDDICFKRPGTGLLPTERDVVIGLRLSNDVGENRVLRFQDIDWP